MEKENLRRREEAARTTAAVTAVVTETAPSTRTPIDVRDQLEPEPIEPLVNDKTPTVHSASVLPTVFSLDAAKGVVGPECQSLGETQMDVPRPSIEVCQSTL